MKITRTPDKPTRPRGRHRKNAQIYQPKYRPARRYRNDVNQTSYSQLLDQTTNDPKKFTYLDFSRNQGMINVMRKYYEQVIRMFGADLTYFRKFNTFFLQGQQMTANLIYGQDTTAQYYCSGQVRAFLDISTYNWLFNAVGYQTQENINIYIGIQDFRQRFISIVGKTKTQNFQVPVTGNMKFNEYSGIIDVPQFYAKVQGIFNDNLSITDAKAEAVPRPLQSDSFESINYNTNLSEISGILTGNMIQDPCIPFQVSGLLHGELTYHSLENIQGTQNWQIAPQVGDYFNLKIGELEQEYEITQVFDRVLLNSNGINPLLGKYIFQCAAVRRTPSFEDFKHEKDYTPGNDVLEELTEDTKNFAEDNPTYYKKSNNKTNKIAKQVYDYDKDNSDKVYGGY